MGRVVRVGEGAGVVDGLYVRARADCFWRKVRKPGVEHSSGVVSSRQATPRGGMEAFQVIWPEFERVIFAGAPWMRSKSFEPGVGVSWRVGAWLRV